MTATRTLAEITQHAESTVDLWRDRLVSLSHSLHAEPEIAFAEHRSAAKVTEIVRQAGFNVTTGVGGLETAIQAYQGSGELVIGVCAEYDALPGIGHACGHNVNGAAAVGAALALGAVAEDIGITVKLIGTPAEEDFGGKILLLEAGVFDDVGAAMMVHANSEDSVGASSLAIGAFDVVYSGRAAHAAAGPWNGINALDAMTVAQTAIGLLRQQLPPGSIVHGIVTDGGQAPNVIPERTAARYEVRAPSLEQLRHLRDRVLACFEAGAVATGAEVEIRSHGRDFAELRQDEFMSERYRMAAESLGRTVHDRRGEPLASTDMGTVSQVVPSLHPTIGYPTDGASPHMVAFAEYGDSAGADWAVRDGAVALSRVAIDLATDTEQRVRLLGRLRR